MELSFYGKLFCASLLTISTLPFAVYLFRFVLYYARKSRFPLEFIDWPERQGEILISKFVSGRRKRTESKEHCMSSAPALLRFFFGCTTPVLRLYYGSAPLLLRHRYGAGTLLTRKISQDDGRCGRIREDKARIKPG